MGATRFIFDDFLLSAINEFKDPDDKLKAYESIANYAISGAEPVVETTETTEITSTTTDETQETESGAEQKTVTITKHTATIDNAFMPLYLAAKPRIDAGIKELEDMDALTAKYNEYIEKVDAFMKQQEEKKAEEQTDTYGKPRTVEV